MANELTAKADNLSNQQNDRDFLLSYLILAARFTLHSESFEISDDWHTRLKKEVGNSQDQEQLAMNKQTYLKTYAMAVFKAMTFVSSEYQLYCNLTNEVISDWKSANSPTLQRKSNLVR